MGQKVNPNGFRVGVIKSWNTHWYANKKNFSDYLIEDNNIRNYLKKKYHEKDPFRLCEAIEARERSIRDIIKRL